MLIGSLVSGNEGHCRSLISLLGNLCWSMPCMNGGSCYGSAFNYLCVCPTGFTGPLCEKQLGICQENPCGNRGSCIERGLTTFECRCYFDYIGPTCAQRSQQHEERLWSCKCTRRFFYCKGSHLLLFIALHPAHTQALFEILQQAYRTKAHGRSFLISNNEKIDFLGLLTTAETISVTELPTLEPVTEVDGLQLSTAVPDRSTGTLEETTGSAFDYPSSDEDDITLGMVEHTETTSESTTFTSTAEITTAPTNTLEQPTTTKAAKDLCKEVLAHILPQAPPIVKSSPTKVKATNTLLTWLRQHLRASSPTSSTLSSESTTAFQPSPMDDDTDEATTTTEQRI